MTTEDKINQISKDVAVITSKIENIDNSLDKLNHHIEGNGSEGLRIIVSRLNDENQRRNRRERYYAGILGSAVVAIGCILLRFILGA